MSLIYALVSKSHDKVLAEYTEYKGNFETISRTLMKKVQQNHRATFSYEDAYFFHYINEKNLTYMCMTDNNYPRECAFKFLEELKDTFLNQYKPPQIDNAISYSFNDSFGPVIKDKISYFNKNLDKDDNLAQTIELVVHYQDRERGGGGWSWKVSKLCCDGSSSRSSWDPNQRVDGKANKMPCPCDCCRRVIL